MARLSKKVLLARFEEAIRLSGWNLLYLTQGSHPARYQVFREGRGGTVRVYIWNISHGGGGRKAEEYRIQITGIDQAFEPEPNGRTLILGYWDDVGVFAGWDYRHHTGELGGSPSMQVSERALRGALLSGFAPYVNQNGETAIAFRPDFAGTYVEFQVPLHDSGAVPAEADLLGKLSEDPDSVSDKEIDTDVSEKRKYALIATKRALRAIDFARRVLGAYEHQCAMCGIQLRLVDGAHILPVTHPNSTDQTRNGVALCALHHRAYDHSFVTFDLAYKVHINEPMVKKHRDEDRAGGLTNFTANLRPMIVVPADKKDRPGKGFVSEANKLRGWEL